MLLRETRLLQNTFILSRKVQAGRWREATFLPVAVVTGYGLRIRDWIRRLLKLKVRSGQTQGFLYRRKNGSPAKLADFYEPLIERLGWIQENTEGLIPMTIDLWEVVGC
jgi:hypothetical protein